MKIREAMPDDADAIRRVHMAAFPGGENGLISDVAVQMLFEVASPPVLSLVAEVDGTVIGHIAFSPVTSRLTRAHIGHILAPLAVCPAHQKQGIASQLIKCGVHQVAGAGSGVLLVYGDPDFYGRFGFNAEFAACCIPPFRLEHPHGWQGMALGDFVFPACPIRISCVPSLDHPALW